MREFARLTVIGSTRRSDLVVAGDVVVASVLPRILELLDETAGPVTCPMTLVRTTGEQLDPGRTATDHGLVDGELLRLVRADEAPPPPEVADVTEVLGDSMSTRAGHWSDTARRLTGVLALAALALGSTVLAQTRLSALDPPGLLAAELAAVAALSSLAVALGLLGSTWASFASTAAALGICVPTAVRWAWPDQATAIGWILPVGTALGLLIWPCLGAGFGVGLRRRPALAGAVVGVGTIGLPLAVASAAGPTGAAAIGAGVAVAVCGLLPRYATVVSGLTRLDDTVVSGRLRPRQEVTRTIDEAYTSLTWATFGVAGGLVGSTGVLLASSDTWAPALGVAVVTVTALRTRGFPQVVQQAALWTVVAAAIAQGVAGRTYSGDMTLGGLLVALAVLIGVLTVPRPAAHVRAGLRKAGNLLEMVAVVAMGPLILGLFGVYADLLGAF